MLDPVPGRFMSGVHTVTKAESEVTARAHSKRRTPELLQGSLDAHGQLRLGLQRRARTNLRRHLRRGVVRVLVLVIADMLAFALVRQGIRALRDQAVLGLDVAAVVSNAIPFGFLSGWQYAAGLLIALTVAGTYRAGDRRRDPGLLLAAVALATALPLWQSIWTLGLDRFALQYMTMLTLMWLALVAERLTVNRIVRLARPSEGDAVPTLFVGRASLCRSAVRSHPPDGFHDQRPVGFVATDALAPDDALGHVADFSRLLHDSHAEAVVLCGELSDVLFHEVVDASFAAGCKVHAVPRVIEAVGLQPSLVWRGGQPLLELTRPELQAQQLFLKRLLDVIGALFGMLVLSPVFAILWVAVKLDSRGPGFFGHRRLGLNAMGFACLKFRSMHEDADRRLRADMALYREYVQNDFKLTASRDPRLTRVGRFLRRTSLDELPQLFNVVAGDMSLVGPRPIVPEELEKYGRGAALFLSLKPGITGAWAVRGRSEVAYPDRADLELEYVRTWSLLGDIGILLRTIPAVLTRRGAH